MFKTLASQIKDAKKASVLTPLYAMLEVVVDMLIPRVMANLIDLGITPGNPSNIARYGGAMVGLTLLGLLFGVLAGKYAAEASARYARNLRESMYSNIQRFSFSNIDKFSTAGLITRLTTDVTNIQNAFQMILRMCIRAPFSLIFALIMAVTISPALSSVYFVAIAVLVVLLSIIISVAMKRFKVLFEQYDAMNSSVQENVSSIRVVKAFVREQYENKKFTEASDGLWHRSVMAERVVALNAPVMMTAVYTCILMISWLAAHMINEGSLTTGQLTSLFSYTLTILMNLMMLSMIFVMLTMSAASAKRVGEVLQEEPDLTNPENPDFDIPDGSVIFDNVSFAYRKDSQTPVLQDINLEIRSGETIGIIGGTGSSKTSLVNLISRLYDVSSGAVLVGGKDVRGYDLETLRNEVSVVLQKNVLFSGSILDNLRWGDPDATEEQCKEACRLACADEFIEKMPDGYMTHIEQGGTNVSGGQKQRLCIARALLKKPKILILDDSTSAVDTATDAKIRKAFREFIPETTKFIIAQRITSVQDADRILVLDEGRISGIGTHAELLENSAIYREVYESQMKGGGDFDNPSSAADMQKGGN